jgi:transposase InsO family protein
MVRGASRAIRVDNGTEFLSKAFDRRAYENGVTLDFSRPGKALLSLSKGPRTTRSWSRSMAAFGTSA